MQSQDEQLLQAVRQALHQDGRLQEILQQAKAYATVSEGCISGLEDSVLSHLLASGDATYICNTAFAAKQRLQHRAHTFPYVALPQSLALGNGDKSCQLQGLPAESLQKAKQAWQKLIVERMLYIQAKVNLPLASQELPDKAEVTTPEGAAETAADRIASSSQPYFAHVPMLQDSYLFGVADWYSLVTTLLNSHWDSITEAHDEPNALVVGQQDASRWMSWAWLQKTLHELSAEHRQVGLDDVLHPWFEQTSLEAGEAAILQGSISQCRILLQRGACPALRPALWATALAQDLQLDSTEQRFQQLCSQVEQCNLLTDLLIEQDLETVTDSEHFFLFEESLRAVLLAVSRDADLGPACMHKPFPRLRGKTAAGDALGAYPPSGLLPCRGLVDYCAPLCYLYAQQGDCAAMFCSMYARFWCRLHTIDDVAGKNATLISLCVLFLHLLEAEEAQLAQHLRAVGCCPLQLALPWMQAGFAGHLAVGEVLLLWDRIIGFDSLLPLPLLALAVLAFRRQVLLAAESQEQVLHITDDLSQLKVVPLLQGILFGR